MTLQHVFLSEKHLDMLHRALFHAKDVHGNYVMVGKRHPIAFEIAKQIWGAQNILPPFGIRLGTTVFWRDDEQTKNALKLCAERRGRS